MNPIAVIVGSNGQDGQLLTEKLRSLGYEVLGLHRDSIDITNPESVTQFISDTQPKEIYFLAAHHHSSEDACVDDGELFRKSINIHTIATVNFLDAIAYQSPISRFFYASSCLIFPPMANEIQNENTLLLPENAYAITKVAGMMVCRNYRDTKKVFASVGILYNHESSLRSKRFVSRKIASAAVRIAREGSEILILGNLEVKVDWGYAPDYVDAMHKILQLSQPGDYIIATGEAHSVREFVEIAFDHVGLNYQQYVRTNSQILTRSNLMRVGNPSRLKNDTGWNPSISFKEMVRRLVDAEIKLYE
jgi:GDPmannose 4,6-dehydratase